MTSTWGTSMRIQRRSRVCRRQCSTRNPDVANALAAEVRPKRAGQDEFLNEQLSDLSNKYDEHQSTMHDNMSEVCKGVDASVAGLQSKIAEQDQLCQRLNQQVEDFSRKHDEHAGHPQALLA